MHSRSKSRRRPRGDGTRGPRTSSTSASPSLPMGGTARDDSTHCGLPSYSSLVAMGSYARAHATSVSFSSNIFTVVMAALLLASGPPCLVPQHSAATAALPPANNLMAIQPHRRLPLHGLTTPFSTPGATILTSLELKSGLFQASYFNATKGFPGEGPSSSCDSDSDAGCEQMLEARAAAEITAARMAAAMNEFSEGSDPSPSPSASPSPSPSSSSSSDWRCDAVCFDCEDDEASDGDGDDDDEASEEIDESEEDMVQAPGVDMREQMRQRAREDGRKSRTGTYNRDGTAKRKSHAQYAYEHFSQVEQYSIGRPCTSTCAFGRNCGQNVTPKTLLACHQYSYGTNTSREQCVGEDGEETYSYSCELLSSETQARWRDLFAGFITHSAQDPSIRVERFMVDGIGPVCPEYCAAAYGMTTGRSSYWTLDNMLGRGRSGELEHERVVAAAAVNQPKVVRENRTSVSMEECINWWITWLELEDQMPNEPTIIHRVLVWANIYTDEYLPDVNLFGTASPLSMKRWTALRKEALRQLSVEWFGLDTRDHSGKKPKAQLSLRQRASHSNFQPCPECEANKAAWAELRKDPNRM